MATAKTLLREAGTLRDRVSAKEWQARVDLAAAHRIAVLNRWEDEHSIFNHFTARVPEEPDYFLIKPHNLAFSEVCASDLIKLNARGPVVSFDRNVNGAGFCIHSAILNARPDINSSLHVHGGAGVPFSALPGKLRIFSQDGTQFYNRIGYHDFEGIAGSEEGPRLVEALGRNFTLVLRNHGVIACGTSIGNATLNLEALMLEADNQLRLLATGIEIPEIPHEICERTAQVYETFMSSPHAKTSWETVLRWLDRRDPSYKE